MSGYWRTFRREVWPPLWLALRYLLAAALLAAALWTDWSDDDSDDEDQEDVTRLLLDLLQNSDESVLTDEAPED